MNVESIRTGGKFLLVLELDEKEREDMLDIMGRITSNGNVSALITSESYMDIDDKAGTAKHLVELLRLAEFMDNMHSDIYDVLRMAESVNVSDAKT